MEVYYKDREEILARYKMEGQWDGRGDEVMNCFGENKVKVIG